MPLRDVNPCAVLEPPWGNGQQFLHGRRHYRSRNSRTLEVSPAPGTRFGAWEVARAMRCVLHFWYMGHTLTIRLDKELAEWLEQEARRTGASQGAIVREQLAQARGGAGQKRFMRLAGAINGPRTLSVRKGFSRS